MRYQLRQRDVEAMQLQSDNVVDVARWCGGSVISSVEGDPIGILVLVMGTQHIADVGSYIARGGTGDLFVMQGPQFEAIYEPAEAEEQPEAA